MIIETFCLFFRVRDSNSTLAVIDITFSLFFGLQAVLGTGVYVTTITFRPSDLWAPISFMLVQDMICVGMIVASNLLLIRRQSPKRLSVWMICTSLAMVSQAILGFLVVGNQYYFSNAQTDANLVGLHFSYDKKKSLDWHPLTVWLFRSPLTPLSLMPNTGSRLAHSFSTGSYLESTEYWPFGR